MGRGQIISGGEDGLYSVKLVYNRDRLNEMLTELSDKKTAAQEKRAEVQAEWNDLKPQKDAALDTLTDTAELLAEKYSTLQVWQSQLSNLNMEITALEEEKTDAETDNSVTYDMMYEIEIAQPDTYEDDETWQMLQQQWTVGESNIDQLQNQIDEKKEDRDALNNDIGDLQKEIDELNETYTEQEKEASDLAYDLALLDQQLAAIDLNITAIDKRIAYLNAECPEDSTISAWCADLTEDLSGYVGTVEVPGEKQVVQIQPGYEGNAAYDEDRDGQLFFTPAMTPAQAFYNFALLPGWQKWKPLFRYGTITDITAGLAAVTLDASMVSSGQGLGINQATTLSGVAFEYMGCDDGAFTEGDEVLIMFTNQNFENPKIIGFKEEPQPCCDCVETFADGAFEINWTNTAGTIRERLVPEDSDKQYYLDLDSSSFTVRLRDTGSRYGNGEYLWEHPNVTVTIDLSEITIRYRSVYGGSQQGYIFFSVTPGEDRDWQTFGFTYPEAPSGWGNFGWYVDGSYINYELEIVDGKFTVDLSQEPYKSLLGEQITAVQFGVFIGSVNLNALRICANSGEDPMPWDPYVE
jgi:hypothetical protein